MVTYLLKQRYKTLAGTNRNDYYRLEPPLLEALSEMYMATSLTLENTKQADLWFDDKNKKPISRWSKKSMLSSDVGLSLEYFQNAFNVNRFWNQNIPKNRDCPEPGLQLIL